MFDSVLGRAPGAPGRPGTGTAVSLGLHGLGLALALYLSALQHTPTPLPIGPIVFPSGPRRPAVESGQPGASQPPPRPAPLRPRRDGPASPRLPQPPARPAEATGGEATPDGTASCAAAACSESGPAGVDSVLDGPQVSTPRLLSGPEPAYPAEAARAHLGGTVLVRCSVTAEGTVKDCRVLRSLPLLDEPVLCALQARRYAPAVSDGHPVPVRMLFTVRVLPP
jgi:protein TonB